MKIGIITGKDDEVSLYNEINKLVPKKYHVNGNVQTDIALCYMIKEKFVGVDVDIIRPEEISSSRLKKNDFNIVLGYDIINIINDDPYVKKFTGKSGIDKLDKIYRDKKNNIFPNYDFMNLLWDKKKYLKLLERNNIPISPTIFIKDNTSPKSLIKKIINKKWKDFIIKPIGGTIAYGLGIFNTNECNRNLTALTEYFNEQNQYYSEYLVQEKIEGFSDFGEIKSFWIDGKLSYVVNTPGATSPNDDYVVKEIVDQKILNECEKIGNKIIKILPKINFKNKKTLPALIRIDFACCKNNNNFTHKNFFVNEIESDIAGLYINFPNIKYPALEILANTYVQKAYELV